jgi:hypothetical protein
MHLNIANTNDILSALSGCARVFSRLSGDEYLSGLWKGSISEDLAWYIEIRPDANKPDADKAGTIEPRTVCFTPKPRPQS